jgi:hypothetical protein
MKLYLVFILTVLVLLTVSNVFSSQVHYQLKHPEGRKAVLMPAVKKSEDRFCDVFVGIDESFWLKYKRNTSTVVKLVQDHIDVLNDIFVPQVFEVLGQPDRFFRLAKVQLVHNVSGVTSHDYLTAFSTSQDFSSYCLAYLFTNKDFARIQGTAFTGGVCRKEHNTGLVSFRSYGKDCDFWTTTKVFAHEVGHSYGAQHDLYDLDGCRFDDGYLMSPFLGDYDSEFSICSVLQMHTLFQSFGFGWHQDCFVDASRTKPLDISICGNDVIESDEECDDTNDPVNSFVKFGF